LIVDEFNNKKYKINLKLIQASMKSRANNLGKRLRYNPCEIPKPSL